MAENVIVVRFEEESKAYQAFSVLKQANAEGRIRLLGAVVVERGEDGVVRAKEGAAPDAAPVGTATGGFIGLFVGILGGPLGVLLGGAGGALIGSLVDTNRAVEADAVFESLASAIRPGTTALIAQVEEPAEVIDGEMRELGGTVTRRSVVEVEAELAAAEDATAAAGDAARNRIRVHKRT